MNIQTQRNHSPTITERDTSVYEENRQPLQYNKKPKIKCIFKFLFNNWEERGTECELIMNESLDITSWLLLFCYLSNGILVHAEYES